jgi:hypothetical protein
MERSTQIWVGVVVVAALAAGVYKVSKDDAQKGSATTTSADLPDLKAPDDLDKIVITNAEKGDVVLEKKGTGEGAKWSVTKPVEAPANQTNVKQLLDSLKELKVKEVITSAPSADMKKEFQFEPEKAVHVVAYKGSDKKLDASFGKSGARGQMAMVEGKPGIYAVAGYSSYVYAREVKGWRDTEILKFDDANASQVTIENKNGTFSFTKGDDTWAGTFKGKPIADFDQEKVKDGIRNLKALNAEDFGDGKPAAETGLDSPEAKITISLKDGAGKYTLKIGKTATGTSRYAEKEGDPTIFVIPMHAAEFALTEASKLTKPKDGGADSAKKDGPTPMGTPPGMEMPAGHGMPDPHGH